MRLDIFGTGVERDRPDETDVGEPLSSNHIELLRKICDADCLEGRLFWAMGSLCRSLATWGNQVSGFLHGCMCHSLKDRQDEKEAKRRPKKGKRKQSAEVVVTTSTLGNDAVAAALSDDDLMGGEFADIHASTSATVGNKISAANCPMKGRMAVALASGFADEALQRLQSLKQELSQRAQRSLHALKLKGQEGQDLSVKVLGCYHAAIGRLTFRMGSLLDIGQSFRGHC